MRFRSVALLFTLTALAQTGCKSSPHRDAAPPPSPPRYQVPVAGPASAPPVGPVPAPGPVGNPTEPPPLPDRLPTRPSARR
jgi:hypothetical protein